MRREYARGHRSQSRRLNGAIPTVLTAAVIIYVSTNNDDAKCVLTSTTRYSALSLIAFRIPVTPYSMRSTLNGGHGWR